MQLLLALSPMGEIANAVSSAIVIVAFMAFMYYMSKGE
jgi:hypothetical protein